MAHAMAGEGASPEDAAAPKRVKKALVRRVPTGSSKSTTQQVRLPLDRVMDDDGSGREGSGKEGSGNDGESEDGGGDEDEEASDNAVRRKPAAFSVPLTPAPQASPEADSAAPKARAARGTALTFAGRYPPKNPVKRAQFLAERQRWHDWRNNLTVHNAEDSQASFYNFMRDHVDIGADNYNDVVDDFVNRWQRNSQSESSL